MKSFLCLPNQRDMHIPVWWAALHKACRVWKTCEPAWCSLGSHTRLTSPWWWSDGRAPSWPRYETGFWGSLATLDGRGSPDSGAAASQVAGRRGGGDGRDEVWEGGVTRVYTQWWRDVSEESQPHALAINKLTGSPGLSLPHAHFRISQLKSWNKTSLEKIYNRG